MIRSGLLGCMRDCRELGPRLAYCLIFCSLGGPNVNTASEKIESEPRL
jgi:hypothetical protein